MSGQFAKALTGGVLESFLSASGMEPGDLFVAVAGHFRSAPDFASAGDEAIAAPLEGAVDELRRHLARKMELVDETKHAWLWVTEFPLFDWDAEHGRLVYAHNPFSMPHPDDLPVFLEAAKDGTPTGAEARALYARGLRSRAYDAVCNGAEMASGSVRIHIPQLQRQVFAAMGIGDEEAEAKFGFLLEAYRFGAPPHAGFAFGFDRLVMLLSGVSSIRDVVAFPKTTSARALFEGAPVKLGEDQLKEANIRVR
jgi:aspartyl-tRNA synthetase